MTTKSFPGGLEKRFIKFVEPAEVRGTAMLIVDNSINADEMWVYLPALKKTRRIVASEKGRNFMSSEFSNSDLTSPPLSDFINKHLAESGTDDMWIIESTPLNEAIADDYGFSRKVSYIDKDSYRITKIEFFNFDNQVFKVLEVKSVHPLPGGKYMIKDMIASNLLNNRTSEIVFNNIRDGVAIDDSFFSVQNLER
jgi:outer membrane lipoprotein-sorting protein